MFVGWDWGSTAHDVTVIDSAGDRVHRMAIPHTEDGIARAVATLADHGDPGELPVAIETTRGLVVDRLLAAGHPVIPVHPNAFHAVRPRWGAARAKNDPRRLVPSAQRAAEVTGTAQALPCSRSSAVIPLFFSPKM